MKKTIVAIAAVIAVLTVFSGCVKRAALFPELPADAPILETGSVIDENDDGASYMTVTLDGRRYIPYGGVRGSLRPGDVTGCVGFVLGDDDGDSGARFYTVAGDPDCNFLLLHYDVSRMRVPPMFFRAEDTMGEDIEVPTFILPDGSPIWDD